MVSTCSSNSRLIKRNNSSVGMSNKLGVQVERSSIAVANSSNGSSSNSRNSSNNWGSSSISNSLGSKMISTGSSNSWFIKRNNSSVGVSNELSVQVKRTSIAISTSIGRSIACITKAGVPSSVSSNIAKTCSISGITRTVPSSSISWSICIASISQTCSRFCSKMVCTGSSNCWLINRSHSSVRMGLETYIRSSRGHSNKGSKNQKLHVNRM